MPSAYGLVVHHGQNPLWGDDWPEVRAHWPLDWAVAHLNHGSYGATPSAVSEARRALLHESDVNPVRWFRRVLPGAVREAREVIRQFLGAPPGTLALVTNASAGVSAVLAATELGVGEEVLVSDHAYGAVRFAVERAAERAGASVRVARLALGATDDEVVAAFAGGLRDCTRLVVVDAVTSPTAMRLPVEGVAAEAHRAGVPVLVDAAHGPGMLPVDLATTAADFWVGNLHKWACAPAGTAALFVARPAAHPVATPIVSWGEHDGFPDAFDQRGTDDLTPWLAAPVALALLSGLGWARLRRHNAALVAEAQQVVAAAIALPAQRLWRAPELSMAVVPLPPGVATDPAGASALQAALSDRLGIEAAVTSWNGRGLLRLSAQAYNAPVDYDRLAAGLPGLTGRWPRSRPTRRSEGALRGGSPVSRCSRPSPPPPETHPAGGSPPSEQTGDR